MLHSFSRADAQALYVSLKQLEQFVQGEGVPALEHPAAMGDIAGRVAYALAAFELKYPELAQQARMAGMAARDVVLLDLGGDGYTLRCGYDETAQMSFLYAGDAGAGIVAGCFWDYQELRDDEAGAPDRVLGALARAGVRFGEAEAVVNAVAAFLERGPFPTPPEGEVEQESPERIEAPAPSVRALLAGGDKHRILTLAELAGVNLNDLSLTVNRYTPLTVRKGEDTFFRIDDPTRVDANVTMSELADLEPRLRRCGIRYRVTYNPPHYWKEQGDRWLATLEFNCAYSASIGISLVDFGHPFGALIVNGIPVDISHSGGSSEAGWTDTATHWHIFGPNRMRVIGSIIDTFK